VVIGPQRLIGMDSTVAVDRVGIWRHDDLAGLLRMTLP